MVKAIAYRGTLAHASDDADKVKKAFEAQKEQIDADYDTILGEAIELCNSDLNMPKKVAYKAPTQLLCQNIKANMKKQYVLSGFMNLSLIETTGKRYSTVSSRNTVGVESSALKRKRADNEEDAESGKKPQKQPKAACGQIMPPPGKVPAVDDDVHYSLRYSNDAGFDHYSGGPGRGSLVDLSSARSGRVVVATVAGGPSSRS